MAYCTQSDIERFLPPGELAELTDDVAGDVTDTAIVTSVIAEADSLIDSYVAKRYLVPLSPVPAAATGWSRTIAIKLLYERRGLSPEVREKAYEAVIKILEGVAKGLVTLGVDPAPTKSSAELAQRGGSDVLFTRDTLGDF